jgi:hypothetical protein
MWGMGSSSSEVTPVEPNSPQRWVMHRTTLIGWRRAVTLMLADGLRRTVAPPVKLH